MKILWHSNWTRGYSGYSKQTRHVVTRLKRLGHEVIVSAFYGVQGGVVEVDGIVHLPGSLNAKDFGSLALPLHVRQVQPDVTVSLMDVWTLHEDIGGRIRGAGSRWVPWVPVDHDPCPAAVVTRLRKAHQVVAMSDFGRQMLHGAGIDAERIHYGVELSIFKPGDKVAARRALGLPEQPFMALMVQANKGQPSRKCFQQQFEGFARFHERHPDSFMYLHAWEGNEHGGPRLGRLARELGVGDAVICADPYQTFVGLPDEAMALFYQAADVTLNATAGEGFGISIIESLACGTPVIVTDYTAMSELCPQGEVGWRVGWSDRFYTGLEAWQVWPDPEQIGEALEAAYCADRAAMAPACVDFARRFDADRLVETHWVPLLERLASGDTEPRGAGGRPAASTAA